MSHERILQRRLRTLATLDEAVGALRSLSAQHFRAARAPLAEVRAYRDEVERLLAALGPAPPRTGPVGIVLVAADLGLVGDYTARLVREALSLREEVGAGPLVCLGHRALTPLSRAGVEPASVHPSPTSVAGLPRLLLPLVEALLSLRRRGGFEALWLVAARFEGAGAYTPVRVPVLPMRPRVPAAPGTTLAPSPWCDARHLRAVIVREHLYASLYETLLEALASEHGKRLVMAESARAWLEERMAAVRRRVAAIRRESSTQVVLEIAAGARAARPGEGGAP